MYYAQARPQLLSQAGALWMKHVRGLAAGSPDVMASFAISAEDSY